MKGDLHLKLTLKATSFQQVVMPRGRRRTTVNGGNGRCSDGADATQLHGFRSEKCFDCQKKRCEILVSYVMRS